MVIVRSAALEVSPQKVTPFTCTLAVCIQYRYKATWKREFKRAWREAGPPNHLDDKVDSDQ